MCHDGTGTYKKFPTACGHPAYEEKTFGGKVFAPVDLGHVARNITRTSRQTCGACHFYGGGGDGVKHGDLDSSLLAPSKELDVHMDAAGLNYGCTVCHTARAHDITGRKYSERAPNSRTLALPHDDGLRIGCENCHSHRPHTHSATLNDHTDSVACQTCHIPALARGGIATQTGWDWSTAGTHTPEGAMLVVKDGDGNILYHTMKGDMAWDTHIAPTYFWYDGSLSYIDRQDPLHPDATAVQLNAPVGSYADPGSRIYPFKMHRGVQPWDPGRRMLVVPKLFGPPGSGAYWSQYDWAQSIGAGMAELEEPFSGEPGFIETVMYTPVNHMIAPKESALGCEACHSRSGILSHLPGFYMPGRDGNRVLDMLGWAMVALAAAGSLVHAAVRITFKKPRRRPR